MESTARLICFSLLFVAFTLFAQPARPALIPKPQVMELQEGAFQVQPKTRIITTPEFQETALYLHKQLSRGTGFEVRLSSTEKAAPKKGAIVLAKTDEPLGKEGYTMQVTSRGVVIRAATQTGCFYGAVTLLQLLPPEIFQAASGSREGRWSIPCVAIRDFPRFPYRGYLLDVARHFFSVEEVKQVIDSMALHKLNRLQLHLTDDQGWRVEIKSYPRLTEIAGWRKSIGFGLDPKASTAYGPDGRYGGFYTQAQVAELVKYAQSRHIILVPEIEMPGHASGALSAYPELSCSGGPYNTDQGGGVFAGVFCAGNPETYKFIDAVLTEVASIFAGPYIHIGGDEVPKGNWKGCSKCQARMKQENLSNEEQLQSHFIGQAEQTIQRLGRSLVGWSEIQQGGLVKNAVLMDWIGGGLESAQKGHKVIMSPTTHCYLDYSQSTNTATEPRGIGGFIPLDRVYSFEPIPEGLPAAYHSNVQGAQGNLWTEYIGSLSHAQYMTYPRLSALAEVTWSAREQRNYGDFKVRLDTHFRRLRALGINYRSQLP